MSAASEEGRRGAPGNHDSQFRNPGEVVALREGLGKVEPKALACETHGSWWDILEQHQITLLVSREYEHLLVALAVDQGTPAISFMRLPHPSGVAVDQGRQRVFVAATRNPNQLYELVPATALTKRLDVEVHVPLDDRPLLPNRTWFFPGCLYLHDLAIVGGDLYATAVGQNAVVRLDESGNCQRVWWPRCIETAAGPIFGQNHLQLNAIGAGDTIAASYFSASAAEVTKLRPGDPAFPVDHRGVIFSGASREPIGHGLTRPHSVRLRRGRVWVDNSGYGEVGFMDQGNFIVTARLPGWTRGLCFHGDVMFVATSRVLARFRQYAPGLDVDKSECGLYALDVHSGETLGSLAWPSGNQIFAVEAAPAELTRGLPFRLDAAWQRRDTALFYAFRPPGSGE